MFGRFARPPALLLLGLTVAACRTAPNDRVAPERRKAAAEAEAFARHAIATEQSLTADSIPAATLGVPPLEVTTRDSTLEPLGYGLADLLMTDLARAQQLRIVDRLRLEALLRELQLASTGSVDTLLAPRVGKLVRARRLVIGSLSELPGGQLGIDARIADVATGEVRSAVSASASIDDILRAEKALAFQILAQLGINLTPAERTAIEQRQTQNLAALIAYSRGVRYEIEGRFEEAAVQFKSAVRLDPTFREAGRRIPTAPARVEARAGLVDRAAGIAAARVNAGLVAPIGGANPGNATDPAIAPQTVTIIVTITTPP
jgi:curli biogenesis system outer membrane secretion channel CsgG